MGTTAVQKSTMSMNRTASLTLNDILHPTGASDKKVYKLKRVYNKILLRVYIMAKVRL